MRITNKYNLPKALVKAVENDTYSKGESDYSTTQLSNPSRQVALIKRHWDDIEVDVSDMIYALLGKIGHAILEHSGMSDFIEKRFFHTFGDTIISGQVDVIEGSVLSDWKFTSVGSVKGGVKFEWEAQASINAYLAEANGVHITKAEYTALFRDHSKQKVKRSFDYPEVPARTFIVPIWDKQKTESYVHSRIKSHKDAEWNLPECTDDERWFKGDKFAVMKKGGKKALSPLHPTMESAKVFISNHKDKPLLKIEERKGGNMRCEDYCMAAPFCEQFKKLKAASES